MGQVTQVNQINPSEVYYRAKGLWMRTDAPKRDMQDLFFDLRILLLMLAFGAMGLLSSSHTVEAFSHNAPFALAMVSPLAFELYLIASTLTGRSVHRDVGTRLTQVLIFAVAVIANGASGWQQATSTSGEGMLLVYQVMALIAAPIVPLATMSIGHQLASAIQTRQTADKVGEAWRAAEFGVFYRALYTAYNTQGIQPNDARKLAQADAQGYLNAGRIAAGRPAIQMSAVSALSSVSVLSGEVLVADTSDKSTDTRQLIDNQTTDRQQTGGQLSGQPARGEKAERVRQYFAEHPEALKLDLRTVAEAVGVGKDTVNKVRVEMLAEQTAQTDKVGAA